MAWNETTAHTTCPGMILTALFEISGDFNAGIQNEFDKCQFLCQSGIGFLPNKTIEVISILVRILRIASKTTEIKAALKVFHACLLVHEYH